MVLITLSASLPSPTTPQRFIFYTGLYLVAFGSGGIKSSLLPLGADHFSGDNPKQREKKASFFNWFYFCMNVGAFTSSTLIVWVQENVGWVPGFGIATFCMAVGVGTFTCGTNTYKLQRPMGSPVKRALQVVVASLCKMNAEVPSDSSLLYEEAGSTPAGAQRLEHTADFRCLDKAAVVLDSDSKNSGGSHRHPWRLCTVTQVEELKTLLRLLPIWLTNVAYSVAYAQMYTTFVEQAKSMDTTVFSFHVPPASLFAFEILCVMFWVVLYDAAIAPRGLSQLRRMGVGYVLMAQAMAAAALVELSRKKQQHLRDGGRASAMSIAWLLPQFFLVGGSEMFTYVGQLEFFYGEAPCNMRNLCTALSMLAIALGNFLSSVVVAGVAAATAAGGSPGWIPDDLDKGHLDYFFWAMAGLCSGNLLAFCVCARRYTSKKIISEEANCNL
ncbi:hypothetical protein Taro_017995 [Colocasia esculenta]|uniref:Uncharacterized protein n=1 Tax=Colocasia esculenta TaxID=4460 RepID=A0A843V126_COLES|nr:hypothetical protein [Colocasia esculenta]